MGNFARESARLVAGGAVEQQSFSGAMRDVELNTLQKGMKLKYEGTEKVYKRTFNGNPAECCLLAVNGDVNNMIEFYPSVFWKSRAEVREDGTLTGNRIHTTGTAADAFRACATVQEGMNAIKGREIVIADMKPVKCLRYGSTEVVTANIPVIDFV